MKKVGLFFGSFNPVHVGHMIIAEHVANHTDLDAIWMVVTPQNPLKNKKSLANDYDRLHLVKVAIGDNPLLSASDIEFNLPKPSYTIDTLAYLKEKHPETEFSLIMGGDNVASLYKWKNYDVILKNHDIIVYRRPKSDLGDFEGHYRIKIMEAPLMEISSSLIRKRLRDGKSIRYMVPEPVRETIIEDNVYGKLAGMKKPDL